MKLAKAGEEQLQALGLTITQARRVMRYRDGLGQVSSVAELDVVPGISAARRAELKSKLVD